MGRSDDHAVYKGSENRSTTIESDKAIIDFAGPSGRKTVHERLLDAKQGILATIHVRFRVILSSNGERNLLLKARHAAGETLSALAREFGLTRQRVFQIVNSSN